MPKSKDKKKTNNYFRKILSAASDSIIDFDPAMLDTYIPQYKVQQMLVKDISIKIPKQLSAAKAAQFPRWVAFFNTSQFLDFAVLQDLYDYTIAGRIVDFIAWLTVGKGAKPVLKLKNPDAVGDKMAQLEQIKKDKVIIDELVKIDRQVEDISEESTEYDHTISAKWSGVLKNALTYGKGGAIKIVKNGKYHLVPLHPRDMMYNIVSKEWKLQAIQTMINDTPYTMDQLIYAEYNPENPHYNNLFNGFPFIQRMMDSARTLRHLKGTDFRLIAKRRWAGSAVVAIKKRTETQQDAQMLMNKINAAEVYASEEDDPERAYRVYDIPLKAESKDLIELAKYLANDCISLAGIPTSLFFDESAANYATMEEKMKFFKTVVDNEWRPWFAAILRQWYQRNFLEKYGKNKEYMDRYYVDCEFIDIDFSSMKSKLEALKMLNSIYPIKAEAGGEFLGIENFENMIDPNGSPLQSQELSLVDQQGNPTKLQTPAKRMQKPQTKKQEELEETEEKPATE